MATEALLLSMIQKLERRQEGVSCLSFCTITIPCLFSERKRWKVKGIIAEEAKVVDELKRVVDILRDKKLEEGIKLDYFISDLIEMAEDAFDLYQFIENNYHTAEMDSIQSWIREIKIRLLKLGDDREEEEEEEEAESSLSLLRSEIDGEEDEQDVVGLDEAVKMLIRTRISNEDYGFSLPTLLIKGMPGIGKTTLARQLYNHPDVIARFDCRAWVCVSKKLTHKELLMKLIQQVGVDSDELLRNSLMDKMDNTSLRQMLHKYQQGKRYFIVLDDFPRQMKLEYIFKLLPDDDDVNQSRLLLTSDTKGGDMDFINVHELEALDSDKSWKLFLKTINHGNKLTSVNKFPMHLERQGKEMLKKCGGLPLAIKDVGRQFAKKRQSEWEELLESIDFDSTLKLLESFYDKLDSDLKSCFLHMASYKEHATIREEKLIHIWVAGGVIPEYDICDSYIIKSLEYRLNNVLTDLINESVIEVKKDKSSEYRLNAVLRKLSIKKAEEEIGFEILSINGTNQPSQSPRHRVIVCSRDKFNDSMYHGNKLLVSLFFHGGGYFDSSPSYWKSLEQLRILDFEDFGLKSVPDIIGSLMGLRYLGLRNNYIKELPDSLECLKKLEVLDIALNFLVEVPYIILKMASLRYLYMSDVIFRKPLKIDELRILYMSDVIFRPPLKMDELRTLETLIYISINNWTDELSTLPVMARLCKLGIEELDGNSDVSKFFASLGGLQDLNHLILRGYRFKSMPYLDGLGVLPSVRTLRLDGFLPKLPSSFPPLIENLKLVNSSLDEDLMPILAKLHYLKQLKLRNAYTGQQMVNGFPRLQHLLIEELWNLRNIQVEEGGINWLHILEIKNCPYLEILPDMIGPTCRLEK